MKIIGEILRESPLILCERVSSHSTPYRVGEIRKIYGVGFRRRRRRVMPWVNLFTRTRERPLNVTNRDIRNRT